MSRCFPFPPPGYVKIGARSGDGAIEIESIKLQKERKRAEKQQRKEKKSLKKELLKKQSEGFDGNHEKHNDKKSLPGDNESKRDLFAVSGGALSDDSSRSGLSEEHDKPVPRNLFDLSDDTDSRKRKRDDPVSSTERNGTKLRFSFTFKKSSDVDAPTGPGEEAPRSISVVQNPSAPQTFTRRDEQPCFTSQFSSRLIQENTNQAPPSKELPTGRHSKSVPDGANVKPRSLKRKASPDSKHRALFEDWCPLPPLVESEESGDQEWLFGAKHRGKVPRNNGINALPICRTYSFPRADYIPEAEIYALPFTVPY